MDVLLDFFIKMLVILAFVGMTTLAASWALLRGFKPRAAVLAATLVQVLFFAALFLLFQATLKQEALPQIRQYFDEVWARLPTSGVAADKTALFKEIYQKYIVQSFPAWLAVESLLMGLVAYYLASAILVRVTHRISPALAFREWVIPEPLVFGLILGGVLKLTIKEDSPLDLLGNNLLVFFVGLYTLGGLSIISFFFNKWRLPALIRFVSYLLLLNLVLETVCCFGVLDVWFDFRKIKGATPEPTA